jgi:hypothetical protein
VFGRYQPADAPLDEFACVVPTISSLESIPIASVFAVQVNSENLLLLVLSPFLTSKGM